MNPEQEFNLSMRMLVGDFDPAQPRDANGRWTNGGISGVFKPYAADPDMLHNIFPNMKATKEGNAIASYQFGLGKWANAPEAPRYEAEVDLDKLVTNQEYLFREKIEGLSRLDKEAIASAGSKRPFVLKYGDTYMISDGNHRLAALKAKGIRTARVEIGDLDKLERESL